MDLFILEWFHAETFFLGETRSTHDIVHLGAPSAAKQQNHGPPDQIHKHSHATSSNPNLHLKKHGPRRKARLVDAADIKRLGSHSEKGHALAAPTRLWQVKSFAFLPKLPLDALAARLDEVRENRAIPWGKVGVEGSEYLQVGRRGEGRNGGTRGKEGGNPSISTIHKKAVEWSCMFHHRDSAIVSYFQRHPPTP